MTSTDLLTRSPTLQTASASTISSGALREVEGIYQAPELHWVGDGFRVHGYFSTIPNAMRRLDPFLLLDYHPTFDYSPTERPRGVGVHPHRGIETVTLAWQGSVAHHDSAGNGGVIGPGDAQWMTAASGILHKEYHEQNYARRGGPFHMAQIWVNLPKAHKMAAPRYQPILAERMGKVTLPGGSGVVRILSGEYAGVMGPAKTFSKVDIFDVSVNANGAADFVFPSRNNAGLLVMRGDVIINGSKATLHDFVVFKNAGERIHIEATTDAHLLILGGEPIDEPIVPYGPFVMNTKQEILQAFEDFEEGKFGHLAD
ncbi:MAG TPA: pirin family protein [Polyangiaceae bacterium]